MAKIRNLSLTTTLLISPFMEALISASINKGMAQNLSQDKPPTQSIPFILPPKLPDPIPLPQSPPSTPLELPPTTVPSPQQDSGLPQSITVMRFEFEGNTAFNDEALRSVTAPFTDKPLSFTQLLQAEAAVTRLYTDAGYINSGAVIQAGQVLSPEEAVVKIEIIEGGVEDIKVTVQGRLNANYVRSRLAIATSKPLNQNRLLEALQLLQLNPLIKKIFADLSVGTRPELSILSVKVEEEDSFSMGLFSDNGRVPSIGNVQRGVRLNQENLLGFGDSLSLEYANTDGSDAVSVDYTFPLNPENATLKLTSRITNTEVIEEPFERLDIEGDSLYLDISVRQPVIQTPTQELAFGLTFSRQESNTSVLGVGFPLSPGANDNGETRLSVLRLFQEWTRRGSQDVLSLRSQFSFGIDLFDATINDGPPDGKFFEWQGQGQYVRSLAPDTLFVLRSNLQLTSRPLVPLEQYNLGGLYSVRGYRQDLFQTDNGVFLSAEARFPVLRIDWLDGLLQVVPFTDFGVAWNDDDNPLPTPSPNTLSSVGLGLQWQMGTDFTARFDWAIPITDIESQGGRDPEESFYFTLNYRFF